MTNFDNHGYRWLNADSLDFLQTDYLLPGQTLDERVDIICGRAEAILGKPGFAARFKANLKKGWYSLSTPVWTNFGTDRGLPISCFGTHFPDDSHGILMANVEIGMMSKEGGGTSGDFGALRHRGALIKGGRNGTSNGAVAFIGPTQEVINTFSQGSTRRGNFAAYLPIDHPDVHEFLTIKGEGSPLQHVSFGVTVSDDWMKGMIAGDRPKREVWAKVLKARQNTGYPYILFADNANRGAPEVYRRQGLRITQSNLCTEIMLPNGPLESFVCNLSSMNILHFDEWRDTDAVELMIYFLDAVMTDFIEKARAIPGFEKAVRFAERHRALGLGWLGWHSYLQSKMVAFESFRAKLLNTLVAETIYKQAYAASAKLAAEFGEPEVCKGSGQRNATKLAIAPTKSSSFILGQVSRGIEAIHSNYFKDDLAKGKYMVKNRQLERLLEEKGRNTKAVWESVRTNRGSVQHLDFLTDDEREVFKTFAEISPMEVVIQAAGRQKFIDQGQSLNLLIDPSVPVAEVNKLVITAWEMGVKSLYYQINVNAAQQLSRSINNCTSCEA